MRTFVAGHNGMVGAAIVRELQHQGSCEVITRNRAELDLLDQSAVKTFFKNERVDRVYLAAAKVGGILANDTFPADFIYQNLQIQCNVINSAFLGGVRELLFLGSSCIYPKEAVQPINENQLLQGPLESTNEAYAIAKIAGIKLCESYNRQFGASEGVDYRSVMPTNLYGPGDNYHASNSHVIPGMIRRFHEAKINGSSEVGIWGTGKPCREFLHVDDMAAASVYVAQLDALTYHKYTSPMLSHINVGTGEEISIADLAFLVKEVVDFKGEITFDTSKPDGTLRKLMDSTKLRNMGWSPKISLQNGLKATYEQFSNLAFADIRNK